MTVSTAPTPLSYAGNGSTTAFPITWKYNAKSHVVATLRESDGDESVWVLDTDYTLTDPGDSGTLTATTAPATGETLVITLEPPNTQSSDLPLGGSFPSTTVEDGLDLSAQRDAKIESLVDRCLRVPKTDTQSGSELELPIDSDRASMFLAFDGNGAPIASAGTSADLTPVSAFVNTLLDAATANDFLTILERGYVATVGGTADVITLTPSTAITAYTAGQLFSFISSGANTGAVTVNISSLGAKSITKNGATALVSGDIPSGALVIIHYDGTRFQLIGGVPNAVLTSGAQTIAGDKSFSDAVDLAGSLEVNGTALKAGALVTANAAGTGTAVWAPGGHLFGLKMSNAADADHDVTVAAGEATDDTEAVVIKLTASITKQFDATWAVGTAAGGMAAGESLPTSGTVNVWLIFRDDTGVVDVMANNHATSGLTPTLPTNYTHKRYIGAWRTDSSANILPGTWTGDEFIFTTPVLDVSSVAGTATATAVALSVPPGTVALFRGSVVVSGDAGEGLTTIFYGAGGGAVTPSAANGLASIGRVTVSVGSIDEYESGHFSLRTNSSSQITHDSVIDGTPTSTTISIGTYGYIDRRGKDA